MCTSYIGKMLCGYAVRELYQVLNRTCTVEFDGTKSEAWDWDMLKQGTTSRQLSLLSCSGAKQILVSHSVFWTRNRFIKKWICLPPVRSRYRSPTECTLKLISRSYGFLAAMQWVAQLIQTWKHIAMMQSVKEKGMSTYALPHSIPWCDGNIIWL